MHKSVDASLLLLTVSTLSWIHATLVWICATLMWICRMQWEYVRHLCHGFLLGVNFPIHKEILFNNLLMSMHSELITPSITQGIGFHIPQEYAAALADTLSLSS